MTISIIFVRKYTMLLNPLSRWLYLMALIFITSVKIQCQNIAETDNIQPFNQIKLMGNVSIVCEVDTLNPCTIEYPNSSIDIKNQFFITLKSQILTIQLLDNSLHTDYDTVKPIIIRVPSLKGLENSYDSTLYIVGNVNTSTLKIRQYGNGKIIIDSITASKIETKILAGKGTIQIVSINAEDLSCNIVGTESISIRAGFVSNLKCNTIGTAKLYLRGLKTDSAHIKYCGGGSIDCGINKDLYACGVGSTKISFLGQPQIKRRGSVIPQQIIN